MPRKPNTSYTVNKWNTPLFADINQNKKNLFAFGDPPTLNVSPTAPYVDWGNPLQASRAINGINTSLTAPVHISHSLGGFMADAQSNPIGAFKLKPSTSKAFSPGSLGGAAIGAAGSIVGGLAYNGLSGGLNSGAGSAVNSIGSTIGGAIPLLGGIISAGSGIVGGGINALIGTSVDQAKVNKANAGTDYYNSFDTNAGSFDDIQDIADMGSVENAYKGGLSKKSWARRHNEELKRNRENAISYAYRGRENNAFNLQDDQINNSLANFAAFGGYLEDNDMPVIDYDFTDRYLKSKERQMKDKNTNTTVPTINVLGGGGCLLPTMFAIGGDLQTHGADWDNGVSVIGAGGLHEENPNEGVQIGVDPEGIPNLVEEGEVIFNDYVYSNRIIADAETLEALHMPKKAELTYADIAKKINKQHSESPNDPIGQATLKIQMQDLMEQQERQKAEMQAKEAEEAFNALSDEEKVAVMQQAAMAEQQALEQQAAAEQAAQQQSMTEQGIPAETVAPEETVTPEEQMLAAGAEQAMPEEANVSAEGGPLNTEKNLYPDGGPTPWAFDPTWEGFAYYNPQEKAYNQGYLDFVNNIVNQDWVNNMLKGEYGSMSRYNAKNKGYAPTVDQVKKWATDGKYSDWHKIVGNAYKKYLEGLPIREVKVVGTAPQYRDIEGEAALRNNIRNLNVPIQGVPTASATVPPATSSEGLSTTASTAIASDPLLNPVSKEATVMREAAAEEDDNREIAPVHYAEWPRYAGIFGPAIGLGMQMLGIGKPNTRDIDAAIELAQREPTLANYERVNDYLKYRPLDTWFGQNTLNAQARAADRTIVNTLGPGRAAAILANNLNNQIASGNLFRQAQEYADAQRANVAQFNRGTNIQNANAYNQNQQFNASAMNQNRLSAAQMALHGAQAKSYARGNWYDSLYGNLAGIFKGIHDIGRENAQRNWLARLAASGAIRGITPENAPDLVKYAAKGGKIKKKKRGLTF